MLPCYLSVRLLDAPRFDAVDGDDCHAKNAKADREGNACLFAHLKSLLGIDAFLRIC